MKSKMTRLSIEERVAIVLLYAKHESSSVVQSLFVQRFQKPAPARKNILRLHSKFEQTGSVQDAPKSGKDYWILVWAIDFSCKTLEQYEPFRVKKRI